MDIILSMLENKYIILKQILQLYIVFLVYAIARYYQVESVFNKQNFKYE